VLRTDPTDTPRFSSYVVTESDNSDVEQAAKSFEKWKPRMGFSVLDPNIDLQKQSVQAASVDIVIAAIEFKNIEEQQLFLHNVQNSLKEGGKLLIFEPAPNSPHR
jgi:hypothetical protein